MLHFVEDVARLLDVKELAQLHLAILVFEARRADHKVRAPHLFVGDAFDGYAGKLQQAFEADVKVACAI